MRDGRDALLAVFAALRLALVGMLLAVLRLAVALRRVVLTLTLALGPLAFTLSLPPTLTLWLRRLRLLLRALLP